MGSGKILVRLFLLGFTCWQANNFYICSNVEHIQEFHCCYSFYFIGFFFGDERNSFRRRYPFDLHMIWARAAIVTLRDLQEQECAICSFRSFPEKSPTSTWQPSIENAACVGLFASSDGCIIDLAANWHPIHTLLCIQEKYNSTYYWNKPVFTEKNDNHEDCSKRKWMWMH